MTEAPRRWQLDGPFSLIQQIRLVHALTESAFEIAVAADQLDKFSILRQKFGLRLATATGTEPSLTPFVTIDHRTPATTVGAVVRPLIFPRALVEHCRTLWPTVRAHRYSFAGLLTDRRRALLEAWLAGGAPAAPTLAARTPLGEVVRRLVIRWRGADRPRRVGDVTVWSSERGRRFPTKAWDEDYFRMLADSAAVLCPSGDHVWSHRFFEACLCGALPIVEQPSQVYQGFRYRLMAEAGACPPWSADDAEYNYRACVARIVVPAHELGRELGRLSALGPSEVSAVPTHSAQPPS